MYTGKVEGRLSYKRTLFLGGGRVKRTPDTES
nr:MAG TPA: hypothetical protein [Caudoviricetes sp.]